MVDSTSVAFLYALPLVLVNQHGDWNVDVVVADAFDYLQHEPVKSVKKNNKNCACKNKFLLVRKRYIMIKLLAV